MPPNQNLGWIFQHRPNGLNQKNESIQNTSKALSFSSAFLLYFFYSPSKKG
jgi:hypothetical protein